MNDPNIVILAGGISSRMKASITQHKSISQKLLEEVQHKSKSMLTVGNSSCPFLDFLLNNISKAGYNKVVIVVGEKDNSIQDYYETRGGARNFPDLNISYIVQYIPEGRTKPLGTADALLTALQSMSSWKGQSFTVCNSDNLYSINALRLLLEDIHLNAIIDYDRSALEFDQVRIEQFSVIRKDKDGLLFDIIEKPSPQQIEQAKDSKGRIGVSMNIFKFSFDMILPILKTVPIHPIRQEKELPQAVKMLIETNPRAMYTIPLSEHVVDLTSIKDLYRVNEYLKS